MERDFQRGCWACPEPCGFTTRDRLIAELNVCQRPAGKPGEDSRHSSYKNLEGKA